MAVPSSSTSYYWPTYMNPDNGAVFPPSTSTSTTAAAAATSTASYAPGTYVWNNPNNGVPYTTTILESEPETVAVGEAYSVVADSSSLPPGYTDWDSYGQYTAGLDNGTITDDGQDSIPTASPTTSSISGSNGSPIKIVTAAVPGVIGLALIVLGIWFCCRCKKRRRVKRDQQEDQGGEGRYGQMEEIERGVPVSGTSRYQPQSLTRDEVRGIVSPRTQQLESQRQHRIDLVYPSRPQLAASIDTRHDQYNQLSSPAGTFGPRSHSHSQSQSQYLQYPRRAPSHVGSSRHSRWTDDSEFDVMAEDGSTITRTISTTSTRRTVGNEEGMGMGRTPTIDENPFDHPAYTYRAAPQRSGALSRENTLTRGTVGTWSSSQQPSLTLNSTLSPISPITPMTTSFPSSPAPSYIQPPPLPHTRTRRDEPDNYSIHSSEDGIFGPSASTSASGSGSSSTRPAIRRDPTIIRHADSSSHGPGRSSTKIERAGKDDQGVVELPPLYEDATSSWTR